MPAQVDCSFCVNSAVTSAPAQEPPGPGHAVEYGLPRRADVMVMVVLGGHCKVCRLPSSHSWLLMVVGASVAAEVLPVLVLAVDIRRVSAAAHLQQSASV